MILPRRSRGPRRRRWQVGLFLALPLAVAWAGPLEAQLIHLDPPVTQEGDEPTLSPHPETADAVLPPLETFSEERGRPVLPGLAQQGAGGMDETLLPLRLAMPRADSLQYPRLAGEVARERFILFLPAPMGATQLHLAHRSGIDVLPEMSRVEVVINGISIGSVRPENFDSFGPDQIDVPDGVLRAGPNQVDIIARQSHRIACGPEAAFALWTEIDIGASGVRVQASALTPGPLSFLAALSAQAARGDPITIRRPDPDMPLADAAPFIARVVAALGGTPPAIRSASYWAMADGSPELVRITAFEEGADPDTPRFVRGGDGAIVLLVERGSDYGDISAMLMGGADVALPGGVPALLPGASTPLADLDVPNLQGEGRYALVPVQFRLPSDWVLLASQKARLDLDYSFAPGLPAGALMLVKVNGTTVRLLPLDIAGGDALPTLPIRFQANLLRPGLNSLDFEILVPGDPPNMACPPIEGPIVDIRPTSELFIPVSPSMSLPSLDITLDRIATDHIVMTDAAALQLPPGFLPQIAAGLSLGARAPTPEANLTIATVSDLDRIRGPVMAEAVRPLAAVLRGTAIAAPDAGATGEPDLSTGADNGPVAWVAALPDLLAQALRQLAFGDTPDLETWLDGRTARAALVQPDPADADAIWLIVAPGGDPADVARALAASRSLAGGPTGQVALYTPGAGWASWTAPDRPLSLQEPLRAGTLRAVMGNYATLSPLSFVAVLMGLTVLSAMVAIWILILTRGGRT